MMFSLDAFRREMVAAICESQRILSGWQLRWRRSRPNDRKSRSFGCPAPHELQLLPQGPSCYPCDLWLTVDSM